MTRPLSDDLRLRLVGCVAAGLSCRAAANRFGVAASTAIKWVRRWRDTGVVAPRRQGGDRRSGRIEGHAAEVLELIAGQVDITLAEIAEHLEREHGTHFAPSTIWRFLDRHAQTFKKNRTRQRARAPRRRERKTGLARRAA